MIGCLGVQVMFCHVLCINLSCNSQLRLDVKFAIHLTNNNSWKGPLNIKLDILCRWLCVRVTPPWKGTLFSEWTTHLDNYKLSYVIYINITVLYVRRILHLSIHLAIFCLNLLLMRCLAHMIATYSVKHMLKASTWLE